MDKIRINVMNKNLLIHKNGDIYDLDRDEVRRTYISTSGYKYIALKSHGIQKNMFVHRIIASTFIPNPESYPCVNHINGEKIDNSVDNLEWCTYSQNMNHAYSIGLYSARKYSYFQFDLDGRLLNKFNDYKEVQLFLGLKDVSGVRKCASGKTIMYKGYIWEYTDKISKRKKDYIKVIVCSDKFGREIKRFESLSQASEELSMNKDFLCAILNGRAKSQKFKLRYEKRIKI